MKNNVSLKLAIASIKKDKKNYMICFIMMVIAFTFTIVFSTFLSAQDKIDRLQREKDYGNWLVCYEGLNDVSRQFLSSSQLVDKITHLEVVEKLDNLNYVANYNESYFDIASISLIEGRIPQKQDEIIVLQHSGYRLNDEVVLTIGNLEKVYKVVGIMNEYHDHWTTSAVDYFTYDNDVVDIYTYITSDELVNQFMGFDDNCIYNFALESDVFESERTTGYLDKYHSYSTEDEYWLDSFNIFVFIIGGALSMAIFYNVSDREERVFLLRCIGMSKKDMKLYIFCEVILVALLSLLISIPLGVILAYGLCYVYSLYTGILVFAESLVNSMKYIGVVLLFIIACTYLSLLPISIHAMDSLIHKKERKQLKKYHKAKRMTVYRLADRILSRRHIYVVVMAVFICLQAICFMNIQDNVSNLKNIDTSVNKENINYNYVYHAKKVASFDRSLDFVEEHKYYKYRELHYSNLDILSLKGLEDRLLDGRLPKNCNECLFFNYAEDTYYQNKYNYTMGDKITIWDKVWDEDTGETIEVLIGEYTIVGTIEMQDLIYDFGDDYLKFYSSMSKYGVVVLDETFEQDDWSYCGIIKANHDVYFDVFKGIENDALDSFDDSSDSSGSYGIYQNVSKSTFDPDMMYFNKAVINGVLFAVSFLFTVFVTVLLVNHTNKDIKLMRCLGMTVKQVFKLYGYILVVIMLYVFCYSYIYLGFVNDVSWQDLLSYVLQPVIVHFGIFSMIAYFKTVKDYTFYPSEVERYY